MTERQKADGSESTALAELIRRAPVAILAFDRDDEVGLANPRAAQLFGYAEDELLGVSKDRLLSSGARGGKESVALTREGGKVPVEITLAQSDLWGSLQSVAYVTDLTDGRELETSNAQFRDLIANVPIGVYRTTAEGKLLAANPALVDMLGFDSEALLLDLDLGRDVYVDAEDRERWKEQLSDEGVVRSLEINLQRADGQTVTVLDSARGVRDAEGKMLYYEGTLTDITQRKIFERRLEQLAQFDSLTELPNRSLFENRLEKAAARAERGGVADFAVHYLDLDNFKVVNDTFGHTTGDALLKAVAQRLTGVLRTGDILARLGGDEFAILQSSTGDATGATAMVQRIRQALTSPFQIGEHRIHTSTCIGISLFATGVDPERLVSQADTALHRAKEKGPDTFEFQDRGMVDEVRRYMRLHEDLHDALGRDEFSIVYQPQFDLKSGAMVGSEALVRWDHPEEGRLAPSGFIPMCERSGLIVPLGGWVLETVCRQRMDWKNAGLPDLPVAVNLSAVQFKDPRLVDRIADCVSTVGLSPELLELELTETALVQVTQSVQGMMDRLHELGFLFTIDDFGVGYSSLLYLRHFYAGKIKIAQEFIQNVDTDPGSAAIVTAIIDLGHKLGMKVLAEGVENEEQSVFLRDAGCDAAQGFYFSKPLEAGAFLQVASEQRAD